MGSYGSSRAASASSTGCANPANAGAAATMLAAMLLRSLGTEVADLVVPRRCVSCRRPGSVLCLLCRPSGSPLRVELGATTVYAAGPYEDALRSALLAFKERGRRDVGAPLGRLLAAAVTAAIEVDGRGPFALVPVPSSRAAARARGGDHMRRLARLAARATGLPIAPGALALHRVVLDSAGLGVEERAANLHGAIRARPAPANVTAVVVDDIVTTGATLIESVRALRAAGWRVTGSAVIAATPRYHPLGSAHRASDYP